jgi:hypothetical protein
MYRSNRGTYQFHTAALILSPHAQQWPPPPHFEPFSTEFVPPLPSAPPLTSGPPSCAESSPRRPELEAAPPDSVRPISRIRLQPGTDLRRVTGFRAAPAAIDPSLTCLCPLPHTGAIADRRLVCRRPLPEPAPPPAITVLEVVMFKFG